MPADPHMSDDSKWDRIGDLFDRLAGSHDPEATAASEPDPEIRQAALNLWRHHQRAEAEDYLKSPIEFSINPIFQPGQMLLNRFRIEKLLGSGGMGEVYLAWDSLLQDRVALKTIARLLAPSASIRQRFAAEVQTARRITHDNVCRIHDLFEDGETIFYSMKYVDGTLLSELLEAGVTARDARALALQIAQGLHAAHSNGIVHGDFKPGNVIVVSDGAGGPRAIIMDFGLARALDRAGAAGGEGLSVRAGSGEYMAPELQIRRAHRTQRYLRVRQSGARTGAGRPPVSAVRQPRAPKTGRRPWRR